MRVQMDYGSSGMRLTSSRWRRIVRGGNGSVAMAGCRLGLWFTMLGFWVAGCNSTPSSATTNQNGLGSARPAHKTQSAGAQAGSGSGASRGADSAGGIGQTGAGGHGGTGGNSGSDDKTGPGAAIGTGGNTGTGGSSGTAGNSGTSGGASSSGGGSGNPSSSGNAGNNGTAGSTGASGNTGGAGNTNGSGGSAGIGGSGIKPVTCANGDPATCGNGVVEPGEQCDGSDLRGMTCPMVDPFLTGGTLRCGTNCEFMTGYCTHGTCGNGVIDPGEDCEPTDGTQVLCSSIFLAETDSMSVGCSASTCRYDASSCTNAPSAVCGNGKLEAGELCDGEDWSWRSCTDYWSGYTGGQLHCDQATCKVDTSQCTRCDGTRCGDGVIGRGEECDGTNLGSYTCADDNRAFGTVSCLSNCRIDYSQCYGGCTTYKGKIINCN
jgi:hypothetical protein